MKIDLAKRTLQRTQELRTHIESMHEAAFPGTRIRVSTELTVAIAVDYCLKYLQPGHTREFPTHNLIPKNQTSKGRDARTSKSGVRTATRHARP